MGFAQLPQNLSKIRNGLIRASGLKRTPLYISFIGLWVVRVGLCCLFGWVIKAPIHYLWWAITMDQIVRVSLSAIVFWRKKVISAADNLGGEDPPAVQQQAASQ